MLKLKQDGQTFFVALFRSWCYNAVATFSLCLLAQAYEQAYNLLQILFVYRSPYLPCSVPRAEGLMIMQRRAGDDGQYPYPD